MQDSGLKKHVLAGGRVSQTKHKTEVQKTFPNGGPALQTKYKVKHAI